MQKHLVLLFLAILFALSLVASLHFYDDGASRGDCPFAPSNKLPELHRQVVEISFSSEVSFILPETALLPLYTRAPPDWAPVMIFGLSTSVFKKSGRSEINEFKG